jgi:hypothetical protein
MDIGLRYFNVYGNGEEVNRLDGLSKRLTNNRGGHTTHHLEKGIIYVKYESDDSKELVTIDVDNQVNKDLGGMIR